MEIMDNEPFFQRISFDEKVLIATFTVQPNTVGFNDRILINDLTPIEVDVVIDLFAFSGTEADAAFRHLTDALHYSSAEEKQLWLAAQRFRR